MTDTSSPFAVLGLADDASPDAVRKAYRKLALRYHPDRNPGDEAAAEAFHAVREAYEALDTTDPDGGYDAERVVSEMQRAAAEAARRRGGAHDVGRGWDLLRVDLDRPATGGLQDVLATPLGQGGIGTTGLGAVLGATAAAVGLGWLGVVAGLVAAVGVGLAVWSVRSAADVEHAVETHWQGVRDLRWNVLLGWGEIRGVRETGDTLDLALTEAAARRLAAVVPADAFAAPSVYRLPLRDSAPLAAALRQQIQSV